MALTKIPSSLLDTSGGFDLQGNITLGDNERIQFGDGTDLQIYHSGANSFITDTGTGNLNIKTNDGNGVYILDATGNMADFTSGGAVTLRYNNDAKIATSSAGATVTGTLTVTGDLDITGNINSYNVTDLDVTDQTITLGAGQTEANSGGSGIIVDGSGASILWDETNTEWDFNNSINVAGNIKIETTGNPIITNKTTGAGNNPVFRLQADTNYWDLQSTFSNTNDELFFMYNGSTKMAIDNSGNVGIGVTPSDWHSTNNTALQIRSVGFVQEDVIANVGFGRNAVQNGTWSYIANGYAQMLNLESDGEFKFFQASSGTAGNTISFTQAMTLDASGNLGIGTDDPGAKLDVLSSTALIAQFARNGSATYDFTVTDGGDGVAQLYINAQTTNTGFNIRPKNASGTNIDALFINPDGNVGLGTTSPSHNLHVKDGSGHATARIEGTNNNYKGTLLLSSVSSGDGGIQYDAAVNKFHQFSYGDMIFYAGTGNLSGAYPANERMRIYQNGIIGINKPSGPNSGGFGTPAIVIKQWVNSEWGGINIEANGNDSVFSFSNSDDAHIITGSYRTSAGYKDIIMKTAGGEKVKLGAGGKLTFSGSHQGDSVGHFLFTNSAYDAATTNCSLAVQNGYTFLQIMAWTSLGARIGTRTGGWNATGSQGTYLVAADTTNIICTSGGSPTLSNGTGITSDERLKENITDIENGQLAKINALRPRNFTWKDSRKAGNMEGFIAQEVELVIPEAVEEREVAPDPDDNSRDFEGNVKVLKHEVINARLIKAIQELSAELDAAKARITELENA